MQPFSGILDDILEVSDILGTKVLKGSRLCELYGPPGLLLFLFGSQTAWKMQAQILGGIDDEAVMVFKKSVRDECTMISIAAAIVAGIAITAMSLNKLDETHWVVPGLLNWSLVFALTAVFYSATQHLTLGCLVTLREVRRWIRGGYQRGRIRLVPSVEQILMKMRRTIRGEGSNIQTHDEEALERPRRFSLAGSLLYGCWQFWMARWAARFIGKEKANTRTQQARGRGGTSNSPLNSFLDLSSSRIIHPCEPEDFMVKEKEVFGTLHMTCFSPLVLPPPSDYRLHKAFFLGLRPPY